MCAEKNSEFDELTKSLLKKCEATNVPQFYKNCVERLDHIAAVKKIASLNKGFSEGKIAQDIADIPELIVVSLPEFVVSNNRVKRFATDQYAVDQQGLGRVLTALKHKNILKRYAPLSEVRDKLLIPQDQTQKFTSLLARAIDIPAIYAKIETRSSLNTPFPPYLVFYNKLKHPNHKKDLYKLIATIIAGIVLISVLLPIVVLINA